MKYSGNSSYINFSDDTTLGLQPSPISSFQISGWSAMYFASICAHSLECRSMTAIPFSTSQSIPPRKFTDSPTTTVPIPNWRIDPGSVLVLQRDDPTVRNPQRPRCQYKTD